MSDVRRVNCIEARGTISTSRSESGLGVNLQLLIQKDLPKNLCNGATPFVGI
ncbi:MAG: hypothetical protein ACK5JP_03515 [Akkermansiaceae bacterium]